MSMVMKIFFEIEAFSFYFRVQDNTYYEIVLGNDILTFNNSTSSRKRALTDFRASSGHSWNQSIDVQLVMAGNFLLLTRRVEPTGEKQRTT